jgi:addiction module RelE/StbE family toxin
MKLSYRPKFRNQYKKLKPGLSKIVKEKLDLFSNNPQDPKLKLHKLSGRLEGFYAFSINRSYRVIFNFNKEKTTAYFYKIGTHEIYK